MGAKIQNIPTTLIWDRSFQESVTTSATGDYSTLTTGSVGLSRDSDLTTSYDTSIVTTALTEGRLITLIDYGRCIYNCQLSYKILFGNNAAQNSHYIIEYSVDNSNWTNLKDVSNLNNTTATETNSTTIIAMQYFRTQHYGSNAIGRTLTANHYEVRLMGSN